MEMKYNGSDVTVTISTRGRTFTTLPACLIAIANQTVSPKKIIVFDDNTEHPDLRKEPLYHNVFSLFDAKKIEWCVLFASGEGQVKNHQAALSGDVTKTSLIWRLDDDNIPESNVLEQLLSVFSDKTGAVAGLILNAKHGVGQNSAASNKIEDIYVGLNEQWFLWPSNEPKVVDHLYSSFLFRRDIGEKIGYCKELSRVGHREETIFTYEITRSGHDCVVNPKAVTWHFDFPTGGIRDNTKEEMWRHDEDIFAIKMKQWAVAGSKNKIIHLDAGLGDHYAFLTVLPKIIEKYKDQKIILAVCYPDVFADYPDIPLISIAESKKILGEQACDMQSVYRFMIDHRWQKTLIEAYEALYEVN